MAEQAQRSGAPGGAEQAGDDEATRAARRLFSLLRERALENPDDVTLLERLGRAYGTSNARVIPRGTEESS